MKLRPFSTSWILLISLGLALVYWIGCSILGKFRGETLFDTGRIEDSILTFVMWSVVLFLLRSSLVRQRAVAEIETERSMNGDENL